MYLLGRARQTGSLYICTTLQKYIFLLTEWFCHWWLFVECIFMDVHIVTIFIFICPSTFSKFQCIILGITNAMYWAWVFSFDYLNTCVQNSFFYDCMSIFYILLTVRLDITSGRWPIWRTFLLYNTFISILYTFRANTCSSSGSQLY